MSNIELVDKRYMMAINRDIPHYLTGEEVHLLLNNCKNKRDRLLLNIGWQTGARISEILQLTRADIDLTNKYIRFITLKKRKDKKQKKHERVIPVHSDLTSEIATYIIEQNPEDKLFGISRIQAYNIINDIAEKVNLPKKISPHTLRHSFAVNCLVQGVPITVVSQLLGHSHLTTTLIYLKIVQPDVRKLLYSVEF